MTNLKIGQKNKLTLAFSKVLSSGRFILGKEVKGFEKSFADYLGSRYCIGVGNGLEALQIAFLALGIGSGNEVITTPVSAVATTLAIMAVGAKPVFVDTDTNGLLDANKIQRAITTKTKAVLPVHLYGNSVDLEKIKNICKKQKLFLIEDAAQAHGSKFNGKYLGTFGDLGCFSFYPTKNLGALGDGGAITTNNKKFAVICRQIRDYGQVDKYKHIRYGLNSRLDELQAALLSVKLKYLDSDNNKRRLLAQKYIKNLINISSIKIITQENVTDRNFHLFVIRAKKRNKLISYLKKFRVPTSIHYPKIIPDQPFLKKEYKNVSLPNARKFVNEVLSLPIYSSMPITNVDYISDLIKNFYFCQSTHIPL